ncbi:MAG: GNAT family N-acetyltransferase [Rhizobiaceae bacterium]|nr:GNAT family N-acetyltransferase [Rhizobiaceae bacterium]
MATGDFLTTERLILRPWTEADLDDVLRLHAHAEVTRHLPGGEPWTREVAAENLAGWMRHYKTHGFGKLKMLRREDGLFVGRAGVAFMEEADAFELGYTIAPAFQGRGYATEIAAALARWFLTSGVRDRLIAISHVDNAPSRRVLEKIGMRFERNATLASLPCDVYAMGRGDLPE